MAVDAAILRRLREQALAQGYDPQYDRGIRDIQYELESLGTRNRYEDEQDEQEFARDKRSLDKARDQGFEDLDISLADRGILRSGANLVQRGKIGERHTEETDAIARRLRGNKEGRSRKQLETQSEAQRRIEDLEVNRARSQAERDRIRAEEEAERVAQERILKDQQAMYAPQWTPTGQYLPPQGYTSGTSGTGATYNGEAFDPNDSESFLAAIERRRAGG